MLVPCQLAAPVVGAANQLHQCTVLDLIAIAVGIYNFLLGMMALLAVFLLVWNGIKLLIYQWEESPEKELEAVKLSLRRIIFGMVLIVCAYLMVYTVLIVLGVQNGPGGVGTIRGFLQLFGFNI